MLLPDLRESVLKTALEMERLGLTRGTSGNVSARDSRSGLIAITPSGLPYATLTAADITVIDLDGRTIDGGRKPSSEAPMHRAIYRARLAETAAAVASPVAAIVHTHSPFATAFAVMSRDLPPITVPLALLGNVPVVPFMIPGSEDLAAAVAGATTQETTCCLLQNHGLVCTGPSLEKALESAAYVEEGAQVAIYVLAAGGELSPIPAETVAKMRSAGREGKSL